MKNSNLLILRAIAMGALLGCLSAVCAAPVYTPPAGTFYLLRDGNTNTFAIEIPAPSGLDVTLPAGLLAFFPQTDSDTFNVTNLAVTEGVYIDINFATAVDGPAVLYVQGIGRPLTALTDPLLKPISSTSLCFPKVGCVQDLRPLNFTLDLIQFDQAAGTAIYSLRNFEPLPPDNDNDNGGEVPEPATFALLGGGLGLLAFLRRRR